MKNERKSPDKSLDLQQEIESLKQQNVALLEQLKQRDALVEHYEEQFRLLKKKLFGSSSEKNIVVPEQLNLFNEAEITADDKVDEPSVEEITYTRRKSKMTKKENLEALVTDTFVHDLSDEQKICPDCNSQMQQAKEEKRYEIKVIPAKVEVIKHITPVYVCNSCDGNDFHTNFAKSREYEPVLPKSSAGAETLAWLMEQKYSLAMPLNRIEQQFKQLDIVLSRQTLSNWLMKTAEIYVEPLYRYMHQELVSKKHIHADETVLQVLNEPGRTAKQNSYMWMFRTGRGSPPIVVYDYQTTRAAKHPVNFLAGYSGVLQVDGYAGYNKLQSSSVKLAGCWAHVRRCYTDIVASLPKDAQIKGSHTEQALKMIGRLYAVEKELNNKIEATFVDEQSLAEILATRQQQSLPICNEYFKWCRENRSLVSGKLLNAINYSLNEETKLRIFLENPSCEIDNNRAERSIKPFVMGRKAWLFSNSPRGASSSAMIFSLIVTAKESKLKVFDYLLYVLQSMSSDIAADRTPNLKHLVPWSEHLPTFLHTSR